MLFPVPVLEAISSWKQTLVNPTGFEPVTSKLKASCTTNCAMGSLSLQGYTSYGLKP